MPKQQSPNSAPNPTGSPRNAYHPKKFSDDGLKNDMKAFKETHSFASNVHEVRENVGINPLIDHTPSIVEELKFPKNTVESSRVKKHIIKELNQKSPRYE